MQGGFSFCGTDIAELGLEYVPDNANTYVYAGSTYKVHEQIFDGHDGGYYYGTTTNVKSFVLRCIYQETHINDGILDKVERFFRKGRTGRLVFQKRPWVYYVATVTNIDLGTITNYLNGFVTIQMKAYYPYGRCDDVFYPDGYVHEHNMTANSGMLPMSQAFSCEAITPGATVTSQMEIPLHNGGTMPAPVAIEIAGNVGDGVIITNVTTGQKSKFVGVTKSQTTDTGRYIVSDAMNGRTVITDGTSVSDASLYHDYGYQHQDPNDVPVRNTNDWYLNPTTGCIHSDQSSNDYKFSWDDVGAYIYSLGKWHKVKYLSSETSVGLDYSSDELASVPGDRYFETMSMTTANKIVVTPVSSMALTRLNFIYKPTFA